MIGVFVIISAIWYFNRLLRERKQKAKKSIFRTPLMAGLELQLSNFKSKGKCLH